MIRASLISREGGFVAVVHEVVGGREGSGELPARSSCPDEMRALWMTETLNRPLVSGFGAPKVQHEQEVLLHPSANVNAAVESCAPIVSCAICRSAC
jgi:hypothetical protein